MDSNERASASASIHSWGKQTAEACNCCKLQIGQTCDMPLARILEVCNSLDSDCSIGVNAPASLCDCCVPLAQLTDCPAHCRIDAENAPDFDPCSLDQGLKHYMNSTPRMICACGMPV